MAQLEFSRYDPESRELVFLVLKGGGKPAKSGYVCAVSFNGSDGLEHICDLDLGHAGACYCEVHQIEG